MGSEIDVDQSMNISAFNDGYKSLNMTPNATRIELNEQNTDGNISDSGTDSFSEQMVSFKRLFFHVLLFLHISYLTRFHFTGG